MFPTKHLRWVAASGVVVLTGACSLFTPGDWYRIEPLIVYTGGASVADKSCETANVQGGTARNKPQPFAGNYLDCVEREAVDEKLRNAYLERLIARSEEICSQHLADVMATAGGVGFGTNWFSAIFSALATANPGAAATNYAATSTAINAGGVAFNANIYQGIVTPAIVRDIKKNRDAFFSGPLADFRKLKIDDASAHAARRIAVQYHETCSFFTGLVHLVAPQAPASAPSVTQPVSAPAATAPAAKP
ncbi:MAG: hypothetical protein K2W84_01955 [Burkholderiales bacterium]|nr:hypothetical protein [Burkholderiales bacterium]